MLYLVGIFRTSGPKDRISGNSERTALRMPAVGWACWGGIQVMEKFATRGR